eukprot:3304830-Rhodomonas_salina.2
MVAGLTLHIPGRLLVEMAMLGLITVSLSLSLSLSLSVFVSVVGRVSVYLSVCVFVCLRVCVCGCVCVWTCTCAHSGATPRGDGHVRPYGGLSLSLSVSICASLCLSVGGRRTWCAYQVAAKLLELTLVMPDQSEVLWELPRGSIGLVLLGHFLYPSYVSRYGCAIHHPI